MKPARLRFIFCPSFCPSFVQVFVKFFSKSTKITANVEMHRCLCNQELNINRQISNTKYPREIGCKYIRYHMFSSAKANIYVGHDF